MREKIKNYLSERHIHALTNEEISKSDIPKLLQLWQNDYYENDLLVAHFKKMIKKFSALYTILSASDELLFAGKSRSAYEEACFADLRFEMESLFYSLKKRVIADMFDEFMVFSSVVYIFSICINIPEIMTKSYQKKILQFVEFNKLLK